MDIVGAIISFNSINIVSPTEKGIPSEFTKCGAVIFPEPSSMLENV